jgi:hypothetical protein
MRRQADSGGRRDGIGGGCDVIGVGGVLGGRAEHAAETEIWPRS